MARSKNRGGGGAKKAAGGGRQAKSRKPAPVAEVEVVEEESGMGIDDAIPIVTGLLLIVAFFLVDYVLGNHYADGLFFKP
ncbi:MAG: hypothetical protein H6828_13545 [Planctomycetes bacterium]|nr:hypothetical protein [Planctomycetota bacterium]